MAIFGTILSALNIASSLKGNNRRNTINAAVTNARNNNFSSIAAKASEGILQFPVIISDSISYEAAVMTAKALERSYAAFLLTIFSMNSVTNDLSNDGTITNYLRSLHDNSLNATMDSDDAGGAGTKRGVDFDVGGDDGDFERVLLVGELVCDIIEVALTAA